MRRRNDEMRAEMQQHLEYEIEDRIRAGMTPAEARRTALRDFGGEDRWVEAGRAARGWRWRDELRQDVRYALRSLGGSPSFAVVAVLTLAIGIGANTAVFSVVNGVLLRPLAYPAPERLVRVLDYRDDELEQGRGTISYANFVDLRGAARTWESASIYDEWEVSLTFDGVAQRFDGAIVDASYFRTLGVRPALGRFFSDADSVPGGPVRVVLSHELWRDRFGSDPEVVGRTIRTNSYDAELIGVAPPLEDPGLSGGAFAPPALWRSPAAYLTTNSRGARSMTGVARLRPGVTLEQAQGEADALQAQLVAAYPQENAHHLVRLVPIHDTLVGGVRGELYFLLGAVALVLLIACGNVAALLLSRASVRTRELSVRAAIGASRGRLVRQLMAESLTLAALGTGFGGALAWLGTRALARFLGAHLPRAAQITPDARLFGFAILITCGAALLFGLLPALHAARTDPGATLRAGGRANTGGREQSRARSLVIAAESALAVLVLVSAALLTRSLLRLQAVDTGMSAAGVVTLSLITPGDYEDDRLTGYYQRLFERVRAIPGVRRVATVDVLPLSGGFNGGPFTIVGALAVADQDRPRSELRAVAPSYFATVGIPVLAGRPLAEADRAGAPYVAVVSRLLAQRYFPGRDPIGERIVSYDSVRTIIGVVGDVPMFTLAGEPEPTLYLPEGQAPGWMRGNPVVVVSAERDPEALLPALRSAVRAIDARVPIASERTLERVVADTLVLPRFRTLLIVSFGLLVLVLAVIGIYGTVAYGVARRGREFGVRRALGATASDIAALVLRSAVTPVLAGSAIGVAAALAAGRLVEAMLFGITTRDPISFLTAPLLLTAVAFLAAVMPVRRALRETPVAALREG